MIKSEMNENKWIFNVVSSFYDKAKDDILIGYHFRNIPDFEEHIPRIVVFWELQLLGKSSEKVSKPFDLIKAHLPLGIKKGELGRWIVLFKKSLETELEKYPEMEELKKRWEDRLENFQNIFSRSFGL